MAKTEQRTFGGTIEIRSLEGEPATLRGLAAPYYDGTESTQYELWPGVVERYAQGAFDAALSGDIRVLFNHDPNLPLGRTAANTAKVYTTPRGLEYMVELADTSVAKDVRIGIQRGDITGSSIGMIVEDQAWSKEGDFEVRTIKRAGLFDVSPVTFPAYEGTNVYARDANSAKESYEQLQAEREEERQRGLAMMEAEMRLLDA